MWNFLGTQRLRPEQIQRWTGSILLQWLASATLLSILSSCIILQPFYMFYLSGFNKASSVRYQPHLIFSLMFPSPLLSPGNLPGKADMSISARFFPPPSLDLHSSGHAGSRIGVEKMEMFWHHWLTWCYCNLFMTKRDLSGIPPDWQVSLMWGTLGFPRDNHKLGRVDFIVSF